jgi:hypothetical protein
MDTLQIRDPDQGFSRRGRRIGGTLRLPFHPGL